MTGTTDSSDVVAEMWRRFQPLASRRVGVLEAYVRSLAAGGGDEDVPDGDVPDGDAPDEDGHAAAAHAAHALQGGLGSYGLPEGSRCAAVVADLLQEPVVDVHRLGRTVARLRALVGP